MLCSFCFSWWDITAVFFLSFLFLTKSRWSESNIFLGCLGIMVSCFSRIKMSAFLRMWVFSISSELWICISYFKLAPLWTILKISHIQGLKLNWSLPHSQPPPQYVFSSFFVFYFSEWLHYLTSWKIQESRSEPYSLLSLIGPVCQQVFISLIF